MLKMDEGVTHLDAQMLGILENTYKTHGVSFQPIFTKADKVNLNNFARNLNRMNLTVELAAPSAVKPYIVTSTRMKGGMLGIEDVRRSIMDVV